MGSSGPKLTVAKGTINAVTVGTSSTLTLPCNAQANPAPMFRAPPFPQAPAGTSSPRLPSKEKHFTDDKEEGSNVALFCSVQASPVPEHR
ncbi:hypothetical protein Pmani_014003 [Petrolisthes manimaculis]|uniref:Uncharacterized protein n=1 Tax=Petrolisthes manimaculis TaxID=1843537 RepID=A0AAE1PX99_9EUCA|nr:hypothetical protein Pmani_014003 [Petrolisthes manimaculis]